MIHSREEIIASFRQLAQRILPSGAKLILFGSQARGDARADSDWDLLVLLDKEGSSSMQEYADYSYPFTELGWHIDQEVNPLIFTRSQWEKQRLTSLFYHNVVDEGLVLWG